MINLFHALLFTGIVAAAGLGLTSIIMTFFPVTPEGATKEAKTEYRFEYAFFGFAGIVIALTCWLGLVLS